MDSLPAHFRLAPSSAYRWLRCPGSARKNLPDTAGEEAALGTLAHAYAYGELTGKGLVGDDGVKWAALDEPVRQELAELANVYIEFVNDLPGERYFECKIPSIIPEHGGTIDAVLVAGDVLHVVDFKSGRRPVRAAGNEQLQCYINLARLVFKTPTRFFGSIVQPRVSSIAETVEFPREQLDDLFLAVNEARHSNALMPGEHCRFCPLLLGCRAAERAALEAADADFDEIEDASSDRIPRLIALTQIAPVAVELAERAKRALAAELDAGRAIPGFRIAQTLGRRKWRDPDEALQTLRQVFPDLRDRLCSVSLKSPAQIEKLVGPDALAELDLVERQGGQPVLVDASSRLPDRVCDEFSEC